MAQADVDAQDVVRELEALGSATNVAGMARYGIRPAKLLGVPIPMLRSMARSHRRNHELALRLWETGVHEARLLACFIDDPKQVTAAQMEQWAAGFDSWDICDQCCGSLFDKTPLAYVKAAEWSRREEEFVKRAGFVLMTQLAVHDKKATDDVFLAFLPLAQEAASDERNFVKKAVNWAVRQIGKRNRRLNEAAIATAMAIRANGSRAGRWIAADALRELTSDAVQQRLAAEQAPVQAASV